MKKPDKDFLNGFAVAVSFGHWKGLMLIMNSEGIRLALGWLSVTICFYDLEESVEQMAYELTEFKKEAKDYKRKSVLV